MNALLGGMLLTSDDPAKYSSAMRAQYRALRELSRAENVLVEADNSLSVTCILNGRKHRVVL